MKGSILHKVLISDFESLPADPVQLSELLLGNKKIVILFVVCCFLATKGSCMCQGESGGFKHTVQHCCGFTLTLEFVIVVPMAAALIGSSLCFPPAEAPEGL